MLKDPTPFWNVSICNEIAWSWNPHPNKNSVYFTYTLCTCLKVILYSVFTAPVFCLHCVRSTVKPTSSWRGEHLILGVLRVPVLAPASSEDPGSMLYKFYSQCIISPMIHMASFNPQVLADGQMDKPEFFSIHLTLLLFNWFILLTFWLVRKIIMC